AVTLTWKHAHNCQICEDVLPVLADLRARGLKLGLVSNTGRDLGAFVAHHGLDVDAFVSSGLHGKTKPHPTIFLAALGLLDIEPADAVMSGGSLGGDGEGARG